MVSQNPTEVSAAATNRGFVEAPVTEDARYAAIRPYLPVFRPVLLGALFVLSFFTLSWYLMLGCDVGINPTTGAFSMGWGAAWWLCVTSAIAFLIGSMVSGAISRDPGLGAVRGLAIWSLSFPLGLLIFGLADIAGGLIPALGLPHAGVGSALNHGWFFGAFVLMSVGLIFSLIGGMIGGACRGSAAR